MVSSYSDKLPRLAQYKGRTSPTVASGERLTSLGCILSGKKKKKTHSNGNMIERTFGVKWHLTWPQERVNRI